MGKNILAGAWFIAALGGTVTACRIGSASPMIYALVVGGLMLLGAAANLTMIPHPVWFSVMGVAGIVIAAWLGMTIMAGSANDTQ